MTKRLMFTTEGNTLDLQANDILFADICQYNEDGVLSSVDVDFDYRHPNEPCYVTFDSSKPLYARLAREFYGLNYDLSEHYYRTLVLDNKYMLVPNLSDIEDEDEILNEVYVVNGLDVNNESLLLQLDNKHDNLYLDLITFTYCDIPIDLRNMKDAKVALSPTRIFVKDESNDIRHSFRYKNYVYTSSMRVYNKNNNDVIDLSYMGRSGMSGLVYKYRLKFRNKTSNYAKLEDVLNTPNTVIARKHITYELQGSMGSITDLGRFMVEFAQYTYEGVREVCAVDDHCDVLFDYSRPLYAEGIPESNYFNETLIRYGLAVFTNNLEPPYPCVVNPSSVYGSDDYTSINMDTDVQTLLVGLKALPFVVVHLDFTSFSDLGSTVNIKVQLDGYDAWTSSGYKVSTSSSEDLLLAFYPSDKHVTKYFNISVKLGDGSYQLYNRYSFDSNVDYNNSTDAVIVE